MRVAQDTGRFAASVPLYLDMIEKQLTFDALKIIGFDIALAQALAGEMRFLQSLAQAGKIIQGLVVAAERRLGHNIAGLLRRHGRVLTPARGFPPNGFGRTGCEPRGIWSASEFPGGAWPLAAGVCAFAEAVGPVCRSAAGCRRDFYHRLRSVAARL